MESLESKLDRLSPEQRREVEDFVDFLLYRSGSPQCAYSPATPNPSVLTSAPPVVPVMAQTVIQETPLATVNEQHIRQAEPSSLEVPEEQSSLIQEITVEVEDRISRDYMDYGQFEQESPATEAVKKVKARIIRKDGPDRSNHLLEWID
jgi:hypothetical protein